MEIDVNLVFFQVGYRVYCSLKCSASSKITRNKYKNTCQKRYGVEHYAQTKECQEKMRQTTKERYGVYNYTQTNEYKEKSKKTCQKKYNVNNYTQTQEYKEKFVKKNMGCIIMLKQKSVEKK